MPHKIDFEARDVQLIDILFAHKKLRVPRYQRPYVWTADQMEDFWMDLNDESANFLGSIILCTQSSEKSGYHEIIDGQQRLLTITIICAALRDLAGKIDSKRADVYHRHDIVIEDSDGKLVKRIVCAETVDNYISE